MKIIVDDQEEAITVSKFLVSLCNDIRLFEKDEVKVVCVEKALLLMRDSIEVKK
jgi:hypothetical protein